MVFATLGVVFVSSGSGAPAPARPSAAPIAGSEADGEARLSLPEPTGRLARGIERSRAVITIRRGARAYELRGGLDLSEGYRFRGRITESSDRNLEDGTPIWLAGGRGAWGGTDRPDTLTRPAFGRREDPLWFDDHPPTLPLTRFRLGAYDPDYARGAEVYAHLSLLTLKHARHGSAIDFKPHAHRNDLTKVANEVGRTRFDATVGAAGTVTRLRLDLPHATVDVRLFASDRPIPALELRGLAME